MLTAGLFLIMFIALCGVFLFPVSTLTGLLCALLTGGIAVLYLLFQKKLPKIAGIIIECTAIAVGMVLLFAGKAKGQEHYLMEYAIRLADTEWMISHQDKKADKALAKMEKDYADADGVKGLNALSCILDDDLESAREYLEEYSTHDRDYYSKMEMYYIFDTENDTTGDLQRLYLDAAKEHPSWEYAQRMAGISQYDLQNFVSAQYYLACALELDPTQPEPYYYLGAIACRQGDYDAATEYFMQSLDNGAGEEIRSWILWHLEQMEEEEEE